MCVLNATALATEVIKNLVLPGVGQFTVVDKQRVTGDAVKKIHLSSAASQRALARCERHTSHRTTRVCSSRGEFRLSQRTCEWLFDLVLLLLAPCPCCLSAERDLGNNFFVTQFSLGEPRCQVITNLLLELNDEVKGTAVDEDPVELINSSPEFFSKFSCVVATDLPEPALLKLASQLWDKQVPLCVGRAYGMIGLWRNVLPEVCVIESRPEYTKENYRIASPFPQLEAFAAQYDIDTCKHPHLPLTETPAGPGKYTDSQGRPVVPKAHSHTPAFVVLIQVSPSHASHDPARRTRATERKAAAAVCVDPN